VVPKTMQPAMLEPGRHQGYKEKTSPCPTLEIKALEASASILPRPFHKYAPLSECSRHLFFWCYNKIAKAENSIKKKGRFSSQSWRLRVQYQVVPSVWPLLRASGQMESLW
jgi:hypothetical protein